MAFYKTGCGRKIHFEHFRGSKRPVLLIHGWAMSTEIWASLIEQLVMAGHEVVAMDHRGCGRSDRDFEDMSIKAIASDAAGIAAKLNLSQTVINGWSLGGMIAAETASRLGERAAGLVLTCPASPRLTPASDFPYGAAPESYTQMPAALATDRAGFFHNIAGAVCAKDVGQAAIDWMWSIFMGSGPFVFQSIVDASDQDQRQLLGELKIPVLAILGGSDVFVQPEIGQQAAACAQNGRTAIFEESGHAPFLEEPDRYIATLLEFLDQI
jgi:pimeloyl-[acyl-carrier protein] methyl ester esterase